MSKNLKRLLQTTIIVLTGLIVLLFVSAGCLQDLITPCYINEDAAIYADEPLTEITPWTTILDAKRIDAKMDYVNEVGKLEYTYLKNNLLFHLMNAEQLKQSVFSTDGILSLLLIGGPSLALGAYGISKPADKRKVVDLERKLNGAI